MPEHSDLKNEKSSESDPCSPSTLSSGDLSKRDYDEEANEVVSKSSASNGSHGIGCSILNSSHNMTDYLRSLLSKLLSNKTSVDRENAKQSRENAKQRDDEIAETELLKCNQLSKGIWLVCITKSFGSRRLSQGICTNRCFPLQRT